MEFNDSGSGWDDDNTTFSTYLPDVESTTQMSEDDRIKFLCRGLKAIPCNDSHGAVCYRGGVCCWIERLSEQQCLCLPGFGGKYCQVIVVDSFDSEQEKVTAITVSSFISLLIGLVALIAFFVLLILILRRKITLRQLKPDYQQNLMDLEEELNQMPPATKVIHLSRLSKKFKAIALETVDESLQSTNQNNVNAASKMRLSSTACDYLPRWSSSPSCLQSTTPTTDRNTDVIDGGLGNNNSKSNDSSIPLTASEARKLKQVLSHPL